MAAIAAGAPPRQILGVGPQATAAEVQQAYLRLARALHPDQPAFIHSNRTADATRAMAALNGARTALCQGDTAAGARSSGGNESQGAASERQRTAQALVQKATAQIHSNMWEEAEQTLALARASLGPDYNAMCATQLAWAIMNNPSRREAARDEEGIAMLNAVLDRGGDASARALAHYYLALRLRRLNRDERALDHARKAVDLDPRLQPAASLVHLLVRRRERGGASVSGDKLVGFWRRLFGRD